MSATTTEYTVGLWDALTRAATLARRGHADPARPLHQSLRYLTYQVRRRNWRAVRNHLVLPYRCESIGPAPRCGWGWTPAGARRHLRRLLAP